MDTKALSKIGYGLYLLSANEQGKDNACIVNTVMQVTSNPLQIVVCVNKENYTCEIIQHTKKFNVSVLTEEVGFDVFENFGYKSICKPNCVATLGKTGGKGGFLVKNKGI